MRNIWRLFSYDIKHLFCNVITIVIVLGLVFLPSIFTWYNVIACWDVFDNTGNLKVAVANNDAGYESDLIAININVGDTVESTLRENDQLDWVFTTEEDAIDGAKSGKYYAAVVIPEDFSRDMFSFYSDDTEHAQIIYYTNEKKNAVAPRVTDQGADQVSAQINQAFAETLSDVILALADSVGSYADSNDAGGQITQLSNTISAAGDEMSTTAGVLDAYASLVETSQQLVDSSSTLLSDAKSAAKSAASAAEDGKAGASTIASALTTATNSLSNAIEGSANSFSNVSDAVDKAYASIDSLSAQSADDLYAQADDVQKRIDAYGELKSALEAMRDRFQLEDPENNTAIVVAFDLAIDQVRILMDTLPDLKDALNDAAEAVKAGDASANDKRDEVRSEISKARFAVDELKTKYNNDLKPTLAEVTNSVSNTVDRLSTSVTTLDNVGSELQGTANSVSGKLSDAHSQIQSHADELRASAEKLQNLATAINDAIVSGSTEQLKELIGSDPETLASAISAPVGVERVAVFPVDNFGSAMAPLYTTLALWVGALLTMVLINPVVSQTAQQRLTNPRSWQLFFGRYGVVAVVAFMQSTVLALGNAFFLGVQVSDYLLFFITYWAAGFVFSFIVYTLVSLFANLGKALAVLLLIVYVTGGGGSFPLQLLPDFFQNISPFLPATHVINCMRSSMMGVYQNDFWVELACLLSFLVPFIVLGFMRPLFAKLIDWYVERVDESKLVS